MELPEDTELSVHDGYGTEDGYEIHYTVWEEVPPSQPKNQEGEAIQHEAVFFAPDLGLPFDALDQDIRQETLQLDLESVAVHHVESVKYKTSRHLVTRHRSVKGEEPF